MRAQFSTKLQALFEHDGMMQVESPRDLLFVCSEVAKLTKAFILKEQITVTRKLQPILNSNKISKPLRLRTAGCNLFALLTR